MTHSDFYVNYFMACLQREGLKTLRGKTLVALSNDYVLIYVSEINIFSA